MKFTCHSTSWEKLIVTLYTSSPAYSIHWTNISILVSCTLADTVSQLQGLGLSGDANTTNIDDFYFQCNRFYKYTTFLNAFRNCSLTEAFTILQVFWTVIENMDHSCHKNIDYIVWQVFFPHCSDETTENNWMASYLNVVCEEMCREILAACFTALQPFINFVNCSYYVKLSNISCTYKPVTYN